MKTKILILILAVSLAGNVIALFFADKMLHYREFVRYIDTSFPNEGVRLADSAAVRSANIENLGVFIGGNLPRYWFFPSDFPYFIANRSGVEETITDTLKRFDETVISAGADFVIVNAGFCNIVTAVRQGRDPASVIEKNFGVIRQITDLARQNSIVPILSSLPPVRPRFLLPHLKMVDYSAKYKHGENRAIAQFNTLLQKYCEENHLFFIDFHKALSDDKGELIREYSITDGEHLNHKGYVYLSGFLRSELDRIFKKNQ